MNTILKIRQTVKTIDGLKIYKLQDSLEDERLVSYSYSDKTDLSEYAEHDRVFNDVDVIEELLVDKMETPNVISNLEYKTSCHVPITTYKNTIKLLCDYQNKLKR